MARCNRELRTMTRSAYDLQKLRIGMGNRLVAQFKGKLGQAPSKSEDTLDPKSKELLAKIRANHKLVTTGAIEELEDPAALVDNQMGVTESLSEKKAKAEAGLIAQLVEISYRKVIAVNDDTDAKPTNDKEKGISSNHGDMPKVKKFKGDAIISEYSELMLIQQYKEIKAQEETQFDRLRFLLADFPLYTEFLKGIKGVGVAMASVILSEFNIETAKYTSSFHMYAGLDVGPDGRGRSRRANHLVERAYTDKDGKAAVRNSITFDPFLKTKLMGVLSGSFLRAGQNKYSDIYRAYKNRITNMPAHAEKTKAHIHWMSLRYMVKLFLIDLWCNWRVIEGLPIRAPYHVAKLGYGDHGLLDELKTRYAGKYEVRVMRSDRPDSWDISNNPIEDNGWGVSETATTPT